MAHVIGQFVLAILESLAELFCFFTGKWLLLLITGGRVVPMPPTTPRSWSLSPFKYSGSWSGSVCTFCFANRTED